MNIKDNDAMYLYYKDLIIVICFLTLPFFHAGTS